MLTSSQRSCKWCKMAYDVGRAEQHKCLVLSPLLANYWLGGSSRRRRDAYKLLRRIRRELVRTHGPDQYENPIDITGEVSEDSDDSVAPTYQEQRVTAASDYASTSSRAHELGVEQTESEADETPTESETEVVQD